MDNYEQIIEQQKAAFAAQQRVLATIQQQKGEIFDALIDEVFEFLILIQNDDTFIFGTHNKPLLDMWRDDGATMAVSKTTMKSCNHSHLYSTLRTNTGHYIHFNVTENYLPLIILETLNDYKVTKKVNYNTVAAFAKDFIVICLEKAKKINSSGL